MTTVRIAFWNVENLFNWRLKVGRGPTTRAEYRAKLHAVSRTIKSLFGKNMADVLGLAEIGSQDVLKDVLSLLPGGFGREWAKEGKVDKTGIAILYRQSMFRLLGSAQYPDAATIAADKDRPKYLNVRLEENTTNMELLFSVCHWKSNMGGTGKTTIDRRITARKLADDLLNTATSRNLPAIVMGDFNANPYDGIFDAQRLRGRRSFSTIDAWKNATATFYNPSWRFLVPSDYCSVGLKGGHRKRRVFRTIFLFVPNSELSNGNED